MRFFNKLLRLRKEIQGDAANANAWPDPDRIAYLKKKVQRWTRKAEALEKVKIRHDPPDDNKWMRDRLGELARSIEEMKEESRTSREEWREMREEWRTMVSKPIKPYYHADFKFAARYSSKSSTRGDVGLILRVRPIVRIGQGRSSDQYPRPASASEGEMTGGRGTFLSFLLCSFFHFPVCFPFPFPLFLVCDPDSRMDFATGVLAFGVTTLVKGLGLYVMAGKSEEILFTLLPYIKAQRRFARPSNSSEITD